MHVGRMVGNPLGGSVPEELPGIPPLTQFLDMRIADARNSIISLFVPSDRIELLTHLFANGQYRQTRGTDFTPINLEFAFEVEDTGPGALLAVVLAKQYDDLSPVNYAIQFDLTGAGINETGTTLGLSAQITPMAGNWNRIVIKTTNLVSAQLAMQVTVSGGDTRIGSFSVVGRNNGALRLDLSSNFAADWTPALTPNGLTASSDTAYDLLDSVTTLDDLFRFVVEFREQLSNTNRHNFSAIQSGPKNSIEGLSIPTRGILPACTHNRVHLKWPSLQISGVLSIRIEISRNADAFSTLDTINVESTSYVTSPLQPGVYRFRLRALDSAGNASAIPSISDFSPTIWFDQSDPSKIFSDTPGTVLIQDDQEPIARINNKGSIGAFLQQTTLGNRPLFVVSGINYGAGVQVPNTTRHMTGGAAAPWLGAGQSFDLFMSFTLESIPIANPVDDPGTTTYHSIFAFDGFFELVAADFTDHYFSDPELDDNTGNSIIARLQTGAGPAIIVLPFKTSQITFIRASYDGSIFTLFVNGAVSAVPAAGPSAATTVFMWGSAAVGKGINGYPGPIVEFTSVQPEPVANSIFALMAESSYEPTTFIIPEGIIPPSGMFITFAGSNGTVQAAPSSSVSVTGYNLYHNSGTEEFPDFSTPADTQATPAFVVAMTTGFWRFVMRATDGSVEDGSFECRLDINIVTDSPGVLEVEGPAPHPLSYFNVGLKAGGMVEFLAQYRSWNELAIAVRADIWIFDENQPFDFSSPVTLTLPIPYHARGDDILFNIPTLTIGPMSQQKYIAVAKTISVDGDYNHEFISVEFTPISSTPSRIAGLRGNAC